MFDKGFNYNKLIVIDGAASTSMDNSEGPLFKSLFIHYFFYNDIIELSSFY